MKTIQRCVYTLDGGKEEGSIFSLTTSYPSDARVLRTPFVERKPDCAGEVWSEVVTWVERPVHGGDKIQMTTLHAYETVSNIPDHLRYLSSIELEGAWYHLYTP